MAQQNFKKQDIYHTTFDWPADNTTQQRLVVPANNTEQNLIDRLVGYHRHVEGIQNSLQASLKVINVDQPKGDVFNQSNFDFFYLNCDNVDF